MDYLLIYTSKMIRQREESDNIIEKPNVSIVDYYWNRWRIHWITLYTKLIPFDVIKIVVSIVIDLHFYRNIKLHFTYYNYYYIQHIFTYRLNGTIENLINIIRYRLENEKSIDYKMKEYIVIKKPVIYHILNLSFNFNDEYDTMPINEQSGLDDCLTTHSEFKDKLNIWFHIANG